MIFSRRRKAFRGLIRSAANRDIRFNPREREAQNGSAFRVGRWVRLRTSDPSREKSPD
jgi:hypothetical protein